MPDSPDINIVDNPLPAAVAKVLGVDVSQTTPGEQQVPNIKLEIKDNDNIVKRDIEAKVSDITGNVFNGGAPTNRFAPSKSGLDINRQRHEQRIEVGEKVVLDKAA